LASARRLPSSMLQSLTSTYSRICLSATRNARVSDGRTEVGLGDDLDERRPRAVEVDRAHAREAVVHELAGVFLHVDAADAHRPLSVIHVEHHAPIRGQRLFELADLVSLGKIRIEVVLTRPYAPLVHRAIDGERGAERQATASGSTPAARRGDPDRPGRRCCSGRPRTRHGSRRRASARCGAARAPRCRSRPPSS
jgi:hypothetical protein